MIDFEIEDVVVLDESRCQNTTNTARRLYNPIFNGKTDKNRIKKSGERYGVNGVGLQGINCESAIFFNQKNNSNNFVLTICKYLISRTENPKALKIISNIISNPKLDINNVKIELLKKYMDEKEFKQIFNDDQKIIPKKFESKCKKISH